MGMLWAWLYCKFTRQPFCPLLPGSTMRPVDGNMVQLQAVLAFWLILPMNLPATVSSVQVSVLSHKNVVASEASNSRLVCSYFFIFSVFMSSDKFLLRDFKPFDCPYSVYWYYVPREFTNQLSDVPNVILGFILPLFMWAKPLTASNTEKQNN